MKTKPTKSKAKTIKKSSVKKLTNERLKKIQGGLGKMLYGEWVGVNHVDSAYKPKILK